MIVVTKKELQNSKNVLLTGIIADKKEGALFQVTMPRFETEMGPVSKPPVTVASQLGVSSASKRVHSCA